MSHIFTMAALLIAVAAIAISIRSHRRINTLQEQVTEARATSVRALAHTTRASSGTVEIHPSLYDHDEVSTRPVCHSPLLRTMYMR